MQLGITIPLQRHLKIKTLPYGEQSDLFYCWELHIIRLQGKNTLAVVNASNRFAIVLWGMKAPQWKTLEEVMQNGIRRGFLSEGYTQQQVNAYFKLAGEVRRKSSFCLAVNLLDLEELKTALGQLAEEKQLESLTLKEKSAYVVKQIQSLADQRGVLLKWNRKPSKPKPCYLI